LNLSDLRPLSSTTGHSLAKSLPPENIISVPVQGSGEENDTSMQECHQKKTKTKKTVL